MASRNENTRLDLDDEQTTDGPVECLGMTFPSDEARREHFLEILREKLQDPDFRSIEGFPIGEDEDILALSDPPYYTACPNPFIEDFIEHYGTPYDPETDDYHREPFAADVSEGKNDRIYMTHSYHTKVPHKAIMRYVLHYTVPGDLVLDGFCGTGMTGVATERCGHRATVEELDYTVNDDGTIHEENGDAVSILGKRCALLNDLSPAATSIAENLNSPLNAGKLRGEATEILDELDDEQGWMYCTLHQPSEDTLDQAVTKLSANTPAWWRDSKLRGGLGKINYTVWSDIFICPECMDELVFWEVGLDHQNGKVRSDFNCPTCNTLLKKSGLERAWETHFDRAIGDTVTRAKQVPVLINYTYAGERHEKKPDRFDRSLIAAIDDVSIQKWFPTYPLPEGYNTEQPRGSHGVTHMHHFYTQRNLAILAALWDKVRRHAELRFLFTSALLNCSRLYRYRASGKGGTVSGTLYICSTPQENNAISAIRRKLSDIVAADVPATSLVSTASASASEIPPGCVDYIFTDPPFGGNLMYSELNSLPESWLRVFTNNEPEAITNDVQGKSLLDYQNLMTECFEKYHRALKPGRWMTVEFHNSKNSVWNAIQEALQRAGFVVADVRTLDKQQGSFKQVTSTSAVKQDLVISAYKPNGGLEKRFRLEAGTEAGVWDFMRAHLEHLPVFVGEDGQAQIIAERQDYLLFDRMVAFHVQRGVTVPLSAAEFYAGLEDKYVHRHGMYFLPEQAAEHEERMMAAEEVEQLELFVTDESSAIRWLRQRLREKPQTYQDLAPQFMQQLQAWDAHEQQLELSDILKQNFLRYEGEGDVPSQIHSYLSSNYRSLRNLEKDDPMLVEKAKYRWYVPDPNKEADLEKLRHRALMREFTEYLEGKGKLKTVRTEALRAGFKECWQNADYQTIVDVAERLPEEVVQEDSALLMYYDNALMRTEG